MRTASVLGLLALGLVAACGGTATEEDATSSDAVKASRGYSYNCTSDQADPTKLIITSKYLQFEDEFGPNFGTRIAGDNGPELEFEGFETGQDCEISVEADEALLRGEPKGEFSVVCSGDDIISTTYSCSSPKAASLKPPAPPPAPKVKDFSKAKEWSCSTSSVGPNLDKTVTVQATEEAFRVETEDGELTGTRDRKYKPRAGDWIRYDEDSEFGGDCSMTFVVQANMLDAATKKTTLKVRCASAEEFQQDVYNCTSK